MMARLVLPRFIMMISPATKAILKAIMISTGPEGNVNHPKVATVSVVECATVNAVMVNNNERLLLTIIIKARTNSR